MPADGIADYAEIATCGEAQKFRLHLKRHVRAVCGETAHGEKCVQRASRVAGRRHISDGVVHPRLG